MQQQYFSPTYGKTKFTCPFCHAIAQQDWFEVKDDPRNSFGGYCLEEYLREVPSGALGMVGQENGFFTNNHVAIAECYQCGEFSLWIRGKLVYPQSSTAPLPNPDMPEDVKKLYNEARDVIRLSPLASTALLRLAVEKLLPQVGAPKDSIDHMIGHLVANGLPKEVEKALDSVRVIGNEAVHPGTIDVNDNTDAAYALFKLLNFVVDRLITQEKEIDEIYELIPEQKREGINRRNQRFLNKVE